MAMSRIVLIIEEDAEKDNDFAIQELLLDQKNKIHSQIDLLLKVKQNITRNIAVP